MASCFDSLIFAYLGVASCSGLIGVGCSGLTVGVVNPLLHQRA